MSGTSRTRPSLMACGWCEQGRHAFHELEWCACCQVGHRPTVELARKLATARFPDLANGTRAALEPLAAAIRSEYAQPSES